jgi:hypothetical protein
MKSNSLRLVLLSGILASGAYAGAGSCAPAAAPAQVSMTRSMVVFGDLEHQLAAATSSHDQAAIDKLLSQDFEFRPASHPGEPTTRAAWLADAAVHGGGTDQISVRDLGDVAVTSFVMTLKDDTSSYVVDVWKKQGIGWQLISRYQTPVSAGEAPTEDIAPTGKG